MMIFQKKAKHPRSSSRETLGALGCAPALAVRDVVLEVPFAVPVGVPVVGGGGLVLETAYNTLSQIAFMAASCFRRLRSLNIRVVKMDVAPALRAVIRGASLREVDVSVVVAWMQCLDGGKTKSLHHLTRLERISVVWEVEEVDEVVTGKLVHLAEHFPREKWAMVAQEVETDPTRTS